MILWRKIRKPFVLPIVAKGHHKCEWEEITSKIYGCKLCGTLHVCGHGECETVEIEDGHVCVISGVVVRTLLMKPELEYFDTVLYTAGEITSDDGAFKAHYENISTYVHEILLSTKSREAHEFSVQKVKMAMTRELTERLNEKDHRGMMLEMEATFVSQLRRHSIMLFYNEELRKQVAVRCISQLENTIGMCASSFRLNTKIHELRNTVFGLMYLMREGISYGNTCIIPKIPLLGDVLPVESSLMRFFDFKSKYITDIENKCKLFFRTRIIQKKQLMNFHETL